MARSTVTKSAATAPFMLLCEFPVFCKSTDGLIGSRTVRHNENWYETIGCAEAVAAVYMGRVSYEEHVFVVDFLGREVVSDPEPVAIVGESNSDEILF